MGSKIKNFTDMVLRRGESSRVDEGAPTDLFLKISVLHANFRWLGDALQKYLCPWRERFAGK